MFILYIKNTRGTLKKPYNCGRKPHRRKSKEKKIVISTAVYKTAVVFLHLDSVASLTQNSRGDLGPKTELTLPLTPILHYTS
ncbi:hypothetical protein CEXT_533321 [Caerostris extrusa]|uniref:Uncharacterized protein n=1 Tax=Caerostris extrusa TaxID=172846 RepID=A0AAV4PNE5_CAEEX|nr:hypothetical protein CEXT_533321 [Caerostris extrusa]